MRISLLTLNLLLIFLHAASAQSNLPVSDNGHDNNLLYSSVLAFGGLSTTTTGGGIKFCSSNALAKKTRFSIGPSVFAERLIVQKYSEEKNVKEVHTTLLSPGLNTKYQLNNSCYLQVDLTLLIGMETRHRNTPRPSGRMEDDPRALSGLQLEQTFFYRALREKRLQWGIGFFERITDSNIYQADFGGKIYLGFGWVVKTNTQIDS